MDRIGELEESRAWPAASLAVRWVQGFPKQNINFVNNNTICYPCGNYLIFINIQNEKRTLLQCKNGNVGAMATNIAFEMVAFTDRKLKPTIYMYDFPGLTRKAKLKGNAQLDYTLLEFSYCGTYLASYSEIPEYELTLWNWEANVILCRRSQPGVEVSQMTFNPMNWHQLCLSSANAITIWTIERSDRDYHLKPKSVNLPAEDGACIYETEGMFSHPEFKDTVFGPELPVSSIAGLTGVEAETFKPKDDLHPLLHPTVHCWNPTNELYVGCEEGHILLVNGESLLVTVLSRFAELTQEENLIPSVPSSMLTSEENWNPREDIHNKDSSINTMAFHKEGLFASGNDGIVHCFTIKEINYRGKDYFDLQEPVGNIIFSPDYELLLIETVKGSIYTYTFGEEPKIETVLDACTGNIQAIGFITPGDKYCMSVTILGEIYIWLLEDGSQVSKLCLRTEVNDMACCPSSLSVALGTSAGYIQFLDTTDIEFPRVVHKVFLTRSSVQRVQYDQNGQYLITGTSDGYIFILNARPSRSFNVIGFIEMSGNIVQVSTVHVSETNLVNVMVLVNSKSERSRLEIFSLPEAALKDPDSCCNERGRLNNDIIEWRQFEMDHSLASAVLDVQGEQLYGHCRQVPYICSYKIPEKGSKVVILRPELKVPSRHFGTGMLYLSSHGKWLASTAKEGLLNIRDIDNLETFAQAQCHSYQGQGILSMTFSFDGHSILVNGKEDGALVFLKWNYLTEPLDQEDTEYFQAFLNSLNISIAEENSALLDMRENQLFLDSSSRPSVEDEYSVITDRVSERETTWLEKKNREAVKKEIKEFSGKKKELKQEIRALAKIIQEMIDENDLAPEIAQLDHQEFSLDVEEMKRLYDENDEEVAKLRKEAEMENLGRRYLWNILIEQCWNSMSVKGQGLKSFHSNLEVRNFPIKERTPKELGELQTVLRLKKIQATEFKLRRNMIESQHLGIQIKEQYEEEDEEEDEDEASKKESSLPHYLLGSLCTEFGINISLLNNQLELHTRDEKINQIILLKDIIYNVKTTFNSEFNAIFRQKELEIARVQERNVRIQEIITDLDLGEMIWQPELQDCEKPDLILTVQDHEIKVEKYLTPWEREQAAIAEALELERRLLAQRDDVRRRALMEMMNGVLEVKKEDILKMEIPQPAFMAKPDTLWTEDERRLAKEYEKKVKDLNEEKEKYKKSLDAELRKIQGSIQETTQAFDDSLKRLFERKVKSEMVINQEELKITNLVYSLLLDEELNTREIGLNNFLERKQKEKKNTYKEVYMAREDVDAYRENYDNLVAEDKVMERGFKKELIELCSHHADILYKLFKRRPRIHKQKVFVESTTPFGDRPGSGKMKKDNFYLIMKGMDDLDHHHHMPEGLDPAIWKYFCATRRAKVENEQKVKQKAAGLLEIQAFLRKRIEEDEKVQMDIDRIFQEVVMLQEDKMNYQVDLTIQLLLKQGQVETENFQFLLEYSDSVLIHKNIVEDLNSLIRSQGQKKVTSMVESQNYRKGISQTEWEHKKMEMEMEDLNQKAWDIQMLFFSRACQMYLKEANYDLMIGFQISLVEQTIAFIDKTHKKDLKAYEDLFEKLRKINDQKDIANYVLTCNLKEELVSVNERKHICHSFGTKLTCQKIAKERYETTLQQQKLIDISKEQFEQISILQAEVERLRMKTFPALIQM